MKSNFSCTQAVSGIDVRVKRIVIWDVPWIIYRIPTRS